MEVNEIVEGYFDEGGEETTQVDQEPLKKCGDGISSVVASPPTAASGCFDCNICLDFAVDPVVTLCGHLYCWPCIYKWLQIETTSPQQCPVCKAPLSENALVPLYGRGHITKRSHQNVDIPRRPSSVRHQDQVAPESDPASLTDEDLDADIHPMLAAHRRRHQHYQLHHHEHHHHHHYPLGDYAPPSAQPSSPTLGMARTTRSGVLGGLAIAVLPWVFRNHQEAMGVHYASPFSLETNGGSPRLRRQEIEVEMSLHQIWLFMFCCAVLCLLLF
ncbi:E3 ubiquitin-protein ligase RMA3-like [Iris pallida]|uniref:E3 ubiquitin-protein ligase RMA n=1 Tax=Iris pallida TaxID=29817 RepID=A0AAX6IQB5_IRIPA|nr:E3 ubiquitin-protein ligase RMA3-like [Iris pallida]KAJ6854165.1 E3 ubiquitin-protein ligase RMA3-like [Iris pallida]